MTVTRSSLLRGVGSGNPDQWKEFVQVYRPFIERMARVQGVGGSDLDDVVQDVLIKMFRVLPRFFYSREKGKFRTWLRRVVINVIIDRSRSPGSGRRLRELACDIPQEAVDEDSDGDGFRAHLVRCALSSVRADVRPRTWQCFEGLVLERRAACEISRQLGVSENAVYINSSRVMSRVREYCVLHGESVPHVAAPATRQN